MSELNSAIVKELTGLSPEEATRLEAWTVEKLRELLKAAEANALDPDDDGGIEQQTVAEHWIHACVDTAVDADLMLVRRFGEPPGPLLQYQLEIDSEFESLHSLVIENAYSSFASAPAADQGELVGAFRERVHNLDSLRYAKYAALGNLHAAISAVPVHVSDEIAVGTMKEGLTGAANLDEIYPRHEVTCVAIDPPLRIPDQMLHPSQRPSFSGGFVSLTGVVFTKTPDGNVGDQVRLGLLHHGELNPHNPHSFLSTSVKGTPLRPVLSALAVATTPAVLDAARPLPYADRPGYSFAPRRSGLLSKRSTSRRKKVLSEDGTTAFRRSPVPVVPVSKEMRDKARSLYDPPEIGRPVRPSLHDPQPVVEVVKKPADEIRFGGRSYKMDDHRRQPGKDAGNGPEGLAD